MTEKGRARGTAPSIDGLLFHQLDAGTVGQPDKRHVEALGNVGGHQDVFRLAGDPGASYYLVVETNDHRPTSLDATQPVDNGSAALFIIVGIVERMQGLEGTRINEVVEPIMDGHSAPAAHPIGGDAGVTDTYFFRLDKGFLLLDCLEVLGAAFDLGLT